MANEFAVVALIVSSLFVLFGRLMVPGHGLSWPGTYEAMAHIWVGVVGTLSVLWWGTVEGYACAAVLLSLSAFEAAMFLHGVKTGKFPKWAK